MPPHFSHFSRKVFENIDNNSQPAYSDRMTENILPTSAYDLLESSERESVDNYVSYVVEVQAQKRQRIIHALHNPIPYEYLKRSKGALYKPLVRAAVSEKIIEKANEQDISPDRVIQEHASIAFSDISDYIEPVGFGDFKVKDLEKVEPTKRAAIKSIECKPGAFGLHTKVVLHDKHPSLKAMGEMMGLVAPDGTPPLLEYVKPLQRQTELLKAPEKAYADLLESLA